MADAVGLAMTFTPRCRLARPNKIKSGRNRIRDLR